MKLSRTTSFAIIAVGVFLLVVAYVASAPTRSARGSSTTAVPALGVPGSGGERGDGRGVMLYFRHNAVDANYGKLALTQLGSDAPPVILGNLSCEVVHVAGRRGLCLAADMGVFTTYRAVIFDVADQRVLAEIPLAGLPSRCRVAADGRLAALTVFLTGHGYDSVDFSTQTLLIDLESGAVSSDLDTYEVTMNGTVIRQEDFNFWGVTFEPDSRYFYATLSTGGKHYLVRGDAETHRMVVKRDGVECPSLSPDGTRVAFKKRSAAGGPVRWSIAVMDLETGHEVSVAERNSVDDQIEWLDEGHVLYSRPAGTEGASPSTDVWVARADGSGDSQRLLSNAYSPAVLR